MGKIIASILAVLTMLCMAAPGARADDDTAIQAFSAWQARGQIFETATNRMTFVGAFSGVVYVDNGKGPIDAGYMICPTVLDINTEDGKEIAKARCTITGKDGARVYADLDCQGVRTLGCHGDFKFTGGTDRFKGITGGGPVSIRSSIDDATAGDGNIIQGSAAGIIVWPKLTYKLVAP